MKQKKKTILGYISICLILVLGVFTAVYASDWAAGIDADKPIISDITTTDKVSNIEAALINNEEEQEPVIEEEENPDITEELDIIEEPEYVEYTIQPGDSFWSISKTFYGSGEHYATIAADNGMTIDSYIYAGDVIKLYNLDNETQPMEIEFIEEEPENDPESTEIITTAIGKSSYDGDMSVEEALAIIKDMPDEDTSNMKYIGTYRVTGYDPHCVHCCGKSDGITASGNQAEFGVSVGCNDLPLGTIIYMEGYGYFRVDDRGGMGGGTVDIACPSHDACYQMTNNSVNVYIVSEP